MSTKEKTLTPTQSAIVSELTSVHGLDESQISFDGNSETPIFDYEAVCALSLKLTDIASIECKMLEPTVSDNPHGFTPTRISNCECTVTLPDGRTRKCVDSAQLGETAGGFVFGTPREADGLAQNRAVRRGIRSVGINLYNAHKAFMASGKTQAGTLDEDPRLSQLKEIHKIADKLGYTRREYEELLASGYDGRISTNDLNDIERQNFLRLLRSLERIQDNRNLASIENLEQKKAA